MNALPTRKKPAHPPPIERHNEPIVVFVTVRVNDLALNLATPRCHAALRESWARSTAWRVGGYTIMPDHVHLFCVPGVLPSTSIKLWVKFWKGQFKRVMGLDRTIWQRDGWDTQMRNHAHYVEKRSYVRQNTVRRGLAVNAEDWPYQGEMHVIQW
jgi:putative transposase